MPPCERCAQADEPCLRKVQGPGCPRCGQRKVGCSLVGLKWKMSEKKEGKRRMLLEGLEEGSVALLELSDGVMEQVEAMAKELRRISAGILALVEGVRKLTEVVIGLGKKEVERKDKETEMKTVWRVHREVVTMIVEEESESEKEEEEKGDNGKEDREEETEGEEKEEMEGEEKE
jgi:hypothetical protein